MRTSLAVWLSASRNRYPRLRERRIALRRSSELHGDKITALAHRLDEVSGNAFAAELDDTLIAAGADDGSLSRWAVEAAAAG